MPNSLLKIALGLGGAVVEGARIEGDSIIVSARPRKRAPRRPVCGRRCLDGLRSIGIDETSYKRGQRYMTGRVISRSADPHPNAIPFGCGSAAIFGPDTKRASIAVGRHRLHFDQAAVNRETRTRFSCKEPDYE